MYPHEVHDDGEIVMVLNYLIEREHNDLDVDHMEEANSVNMAQIQEVDVLEVELTFSKEIQNCVEDLNAISVIMQAISYVTHNKDSLDIVKQGTNHVAVVSEVNDNNEND